MGARIEFRTGDARQLAGIADGSVDLVVTSPPYLDRDTGRYGGADADQLNFRNDRDAYVERLVEATREMLRVLRQDGSAFVHVGDGDNTHYPMHLAPYYYATAVNDRLRPFFGAPIIWQWGWDHRATTMSKGYEVWFHLARGADHFRNESEFCSGVWAIRIDRLDPRLAALGAKDDHYPIEIARRLIAMFSEPGATVLDPFGGTGTTAIAAFELGRHAITNDISPEQTRYAKARFQLYRADHGLAAG